MAAGSERNADFSPLKSGLTSDANHILRANSSRNPFHTSNLGGANITKGPYSRLFSQFSPFSDGEGVGSVQSKIANQRSMIEIPSPHHSKTPKLQFQMARNFSLKPYLIPADRRCEKKSFFIACREGGRIFVPSSIRCSAFDVGCSMFPMAAREQSPLQCVQACIS